MMRAAAVWMLMVGLASCSDPKKSDGPSSTTGGSAGEASTMAGAGPAADDNAGGAAGSPMAVACNELPLDAPAYGLEYDDGVVPDATGGEITDGTYFITSQILYTDTPGPSIDLGRTVVQISGDTWQEVSGEPEPDSVNVDQHTTSTLAIDGTSLTLTRTCPTAGPGESLDYSVTTDGFVVYVMDRGDTFATVFTKQ